NDVIVDNQVYMGQGWGALAVPLRVFAVLVIIFGIALILYWRKRWNTLKARAAELEAQQQATATNTPAGA
ncbi:MAG: hypothetical protein ACOYIK_06345, partial [Coriobacteriales bacterium]